MTPPPGSLLPASPSIGRLARAVAPRRSPSCAARPTVTAAPRGRRRATPAAVVSRFSLSPCQILAKRHFDPGTITFGATMIVLPATIDINSSAHQQIAIDFIRDHFAGGRELIGKLREGIRQ